MESLKFETDTESALFLFHNREKWLPSIEVRIVAGVNDKTEVIIRYMPSRSGSVGLGLFCCGQMLGMENIKKAIA